MVICLRLQAKLPAFIERIDIIMNILITLLLSVGFFLIVTGILQLPSLRESWKIRRLGEPKGHFQFEQNCILPVAGIIAKVIYMNTHSKEKLDNKLQIAGMNMTAEVYRARNITITAYILILALLCIPLHLNIVAGGFFIYAVFVFFKVNREVDDLLKERQSAISRELPRFMRTITQTLLYDRDLLAMVDKYRLVAGSYLRMELDRLVLDMKTGNQQKALDRFAKRIGIDYLTTFVNGLISETRGVDQKVFLRSAENEMKKVTIERLKKEAFKKPDKLRLVQLLLIVSLIVIWLSALGFQAFQGLEIFKY